MSGQRNHFDGRGWDNNSSRGDWKREINGRGGGGGINNRKYGNFSAPGNWNNDTDNGYGTYERSNYHNQQRLRDEQQDGRYEQRRERHFDRNNDFSQRSDRYERRDRFDDDGNNQGGFGGGRRQERDYEDDRNYRRDSQNQDGNRDRRGYRDNYQSGNQVWGQPQNNRQLEYRNAGQNYRNDDSGYRNRYDFNDDSFRFGASCQGGSRWEGNERQNKGYQNNNRGTRRRWGQGGYGGYSNREYNQSSSFGQNSRFSGQPNGFAINAGASSVECNEWDTPVVEQHQLVERNPFDFEIREVNGGEKPEPSEREGAISPASSTQSVDMPLKRALSSASSTLSITPAHTRPSSPVFSLAESTAQMSLQEDEVYSSNLLVDPPMQPANRNDKEKVSLITNFFPLEVKPHPVYNYDIEMSVVTANGTRINLSKGGKGSGTKNQRAEICVAAIREALQIYGIMRRGEATVYDGAARLYSSESLVAELKQHSNVLTVSISQLPHSVRETIETPNAQDIVIEFGAETQFEISDYSEEHRNRDLGNLNRTHQSFFDVLTNEPALMSGKYTAFGSGKMFPKNAKGKYVGNAQEQKSGISKGIVFIEPKSSKKGTSMVPALVLDAKIGQFYVAENAQATVCEILRMNRGSFPINNKVLWNKVNNFVKGMRFTIVTHDKLQKSFMASGISTDLIGVLQEEDFKKNKVPVLQRFEEYGLQLRKDWPAIVVRGKLRNWITHYPMELLTVAKDQHVPMSKMDENKPRPAKIQDRFSEIMRMVDALDLGASSRHQQILRAFGVSVSTKPHSIEAIRRKMPTISFGRNNNVAPTLEKANFTIRQYIDGGKADDVIIAFDCNAQMARDVKNKLEQGARTRGVKVANWHLVDVTRFGPKSQDKVRVTFENVVEMKKLKKVGSVVLIVYVDDETIKSHDYLKFFERKYNIVTQHITLRIARDLGKPITQGNVLNKMNCKLGGLNYSIDPDQYATNDWITNGDSLIIGYDVSHPTGMSRDDKLDKKPPSTTSVVGMSFNGAKNPETFIGDYHFQLPKKEEVADEILIDRVKWMLQLFYENRKKLPKYIYFIRDGVSEGQYNMVLNKEFPAFKDGIDEFKNMEATAKIPGIQGWQPKFVVVVVCKRHNKRFAQEKGGQFQNAKPGTVVDSEVVRTDMTHFYMLPHNVIHGTGKFPSYHVLKDELDTYEGKGRKTQDKLQAFLFALSFDHQIYGGSISLPEPVYQADEWAKRGMANFKVFEELYELPHLSTWNKNIYATPPIDYAKLTAMLAYRDTCLQGQRCNA